MGYIPLLNRLSMEVISMSATPLAPAYDMTSSKLAVQTDDNEPVGNAGYYEDCYTT